jgi:hypothetical protein
MMSRKAWLAEGHVMNEPATVARDRDRQPAGRPVVDPELADQLLARAQAGGVELLGPDGLLSQVTSRCGTAQTGTNDHRMMIFHVSDADPQASRRWEGTLLRQRADRVRIEGRLGDVERYLAQRPGIAFGSVKPLVAE